MPAKIRNAPGFFRGAGEANDTKSGLAISFISAISKGWAIRRSTGVASGAFAESSEEGSGIDSFGSSGMISSLYLWP